MTHRSPADKRRHPRIQIELPVHARLGDQKTIILQLADMSARGMQLRLKTDDFETLRKMAQEENQNNCFEIRIAARLAWVMPDADGTFTTGWEFNVLDDQEQRIG